MRRKLENGSSIPITLIVGKAGRSVRSGCVVFLEQARRSCSRRPWRRSKLPFATNKRKPFAYFYFDFGDPDKRTVVGILRSILKQFCLHLEEIPNAILDLYKQCHNGNESPNGGGILKALHS